MQVKKIYESGQSATKNIIIIDNNYDQLVICNNTIVHSWHMLRMFDIISSSITNSHCSVLHLELDLGVVNSNLNGIILWSSTSTDV